MCINPNFHPSIQNNGLQIYFSFMMSLNEKKKTKLFLECLIDIFK